MCTIKMGDISWWELSVKERIHSHHDERQGIYFSIRNVCSTCKSEREKFQLPKAARLRTAQDIADSFYVVCTYSPIKEWNEASQTVRKDSR